MNLNASDFLEDINTPRYASDSKEKLLLILKNFIYFKNINVLQHAFLSNTIGIQWVVTDIKDIVFLLSVCMNSLRAVFVC